MRLDLYLTSQKISASRSQIEKWIKKGFVKVNGQVTKPSRKVSSEDVIEITPPDVQPTSLQPEDLPLDILYEDDDLLVINKQPDMVVHPGAGHAEGTLVHALLAHCKGLSQIGGVERPGIVHRLDKGTSGAMVVAKNDFSHLSLSSQFKDHEIKKIYWAVVYGKLTQIKGTLETLITRSPSHRKKFAVSRIRGKKAVTHYHVLKEGEGVSLLEVTLETGRTHQIRVHFTDRGHGIVGDPLYGGPNRRVNGVPEGKLKESVRELEHPLLHARVIGFTHPRRQEWMEFTAPLPADFNEVLRMISFHVSS